MKQNFEKIGLVDFCKEIIIDWLEDHRGQDPGIYGCDFGMEVTNEEFNVEGKAFVYEEDSQKAFDCWYPKWCIGFNQYEHGLGCRMEDNFAYNYETGRMEPKDVSTIVCRMVIWMVCEIAANISYISNEWDHRIDLDDEVIDEMIYEVKTLDEDDIL